MSSEKRKIKASVVFLLFVGMLSIVLYACSQQAEPIQPESMLSEDLECPEGTIGEFGRWGGVDENGWVHSCKMIHGKYHVWRNNVLSIEGQYVFGKKDGKWIFRDNDGNTTKIVIYEDGKIIESE